MAHKTTHIQTIRHNLDSTGQQAKRCLKWSHEEYCNFQFAQYCEFVEELTTGWEKVREQILYSPVFRGFWCNQWMAMDELDFLPFAIEMNPDSLMDLMYMRHEYEFLHGANRLLEDDDFMTAYNHIIKIL